MSRMTRPDVPPRKHLPRDEAGSIELQGGTGGITGMCSFADFLEVYKEDVTFRVRTPESIDPERTNPNARMVAAMTDDVGSSSPAVARILLQGREILEAAALAQTVDKPAVVKLLHSCKEEVIVCEKVTARVAGRVEQIMKDIRGGTIKPDKRSRALSALPQVPNLDADAASFLIHAKRAVGIICRFPSAFLDVPAKDNNFDDLAKTLEKTVSPTAPVTALVRDNAAVVRHLITLRNCQEHPGQKRTIVANFALLPDDSIAPPAWHVSGETQPSPVDQDMRAAVQFLVEIAEAMLICLVMHTIDKRFPFLIQEYDPGQVNPKKPIRYRLSVDLSKLITKPEPPR